VIKKREIKIQQLKNCDLSAGQQSCASSSGETKRTSQENPLRIHKTHVLTCMDTTAYQYIGTYVPVHWYMSNARKVQNCEGMLITQPQLAVTYGTQDRVNRDVVVYQSICGFLQQDLCPHTRTVCRTSVPVQVPPYAVLFPGVNLRERLFRPTRGFGSGEPYVHPYVHHSCTVAYVRTKRYPCRMLSMTKSIQEEQGENKVKSKQKMIK
jgi:hypothetical protein